jgi:hypothetical protein
MVPDFADDPGQRHDAATVADLLAAADAGLATHAMDGSNLLARPQRRGASPGNTPGWPRVGRYLPVRCCVPR